MSRGLETFTVTRTSCCRVRLDCIILPFPFSHSPIPIPSFPILPYPVHTISNLIWHSILFFILSYMCCFALFVCLTLLASFFLPSHLQLKKHVFPYSHVSIPLNFEGVADAKNLQPMYSRLHTAIRKYDDKHIIFFEPTVIISNVS